MITNEHKKHAGITRPSYGFFNRTEWAIVGTQCNTIRSLADKVINALAQQYACAYADEVHGAVSEGSFPDHLASGAMTEYNGFDTYHQFNFKKSFNQFEYRRLFNDADMVLVNGNHFVAKSQVVVIDERKRESLQKRIHQLTNVELVLLADNEPGIFDFIKDILPLWNQLPVYKISDTEKIIEFFRNKIQVSMPLLHGLVLAGGKSERMGYDKGMIRWHGKEQQYYMADLMQNLCSEVYISYRTDQQKEITREYKTLTDSFTGLGPFGAILSAFREKPDAAWMIVACDLPLLDTETLQYLKANRYSSSIATTFESPYNNFPEPLITIWEPKSYPVLLSFLSQGYDCPAKVLRNSNVTVLKAQNPMALMNVNTPDELGKVQELLRNKLPVNHEG
ncbi:MAG: NTP transferase domain-containing protein [Ginsengibacter sp.]